MREGGMLAAEPARGLRWTGLALAAAMLLCLGLSLAPAKANAADAVYIDYPAHGSIFQAAPYDYEGRAFPDIFPLPPVMSPWVRGAVQVETSPGVWGGPTCSSSLVGIPNLCGVYRWRTLLGSFQESWKASESEADGLAGSNSLTDGKYRVKVGQPGGFGVPDNYAENYFFVDGTDPETSIDLGPNQYNNDASANIHFEFSGNDPVVNDYASGIDYFNCKLDSGPWDHCTAPGGSAPYTYDLTAPEGGHTLYVKAVDKANNEDDTAAEHSWIIDETPPNISITSPVAKKRYLLHENIPATFNCSDPLAGTPPAASGIASCTATPVNNEDLGPHLFTVTAIDNAGNTSTKSVAYTIDPPDYGDFVMESHPLAYYRFNEALGSADMLDSSGNHNDGIYQNGIALRRDGATACERRPHPPRVCELANPAENKAAFFPARDGHGYVNDMPAPQTAYTMEAWVKPRDGANMMVMSHGGGGQLFISGGNLAFRQVQDTIYSGGAVPPGVWSHVAATWNGSLTRLYVNGVQVASSTTANKPPSGTSTFYVGYGEMAPWFHGEMDEAAYYGSALSQHRIADRFKIGKAKDNPSIEAGNSPFNTEGPFTDPQSPKNGGLYAPTKTPNAEFTCSDVDDLPGNSDIASCAATVDGNPVLSGDPLPDTLGPHTLTVTAIDEGGNTYVHHHSYTVKNFQDLFNTDSPVVYCRLGDASGGPMLDSSGNGNNGIYKNDQDSGPVGISGDGDRARDFFGKGGYGYINGVAAPRYQSTLEAWVYPRDARDQSIVGHGDAGEIFIQGGQFKYRRMGETVTSSVPVQVGAWQQVAGTWDGADIRIYVNGVETGKVESTRRPSSVSTFYVGFGELAPWFYGAIDEVAYYPVALNANRMYQHWLADPPPEDLTENPGEGTEPGSPGTGDPDRPTDPGTGGSDDPATGNPDTPVTEDPGTDEPVGETPSAEPGDGEAESGEPTATQRKWEKARAKARKRKAAVKKCKKIKNPAKRKACLKRARAN